MKNIKYTNFKLTYTNTAQVTTSVIDELCQNI